MRSFLLTPFTMRSINRVILIGHLAGDPEIRSTKTGKQVASFSIATNYDTTTDGEKKQYVDFHRITAWGKLAEIAEKWLKKGMGVYVEGRLRNSQYEKDGQKRTATEVVLDTLNILKWKKDKEGEAVNVVEPGEK
ncbi:MAG: single-stranded DNA-binding protein [Patescibacteria group bacterium]